MYGRYVTINCLYVKEPIEVWIPCTPDTPLNELQNMAREIVLREMARQLKESNLQPSK